MLTYYLQVIESFKEHQLSILLRDIRENIIGFTESDRFDAEAKKLFEDIAGCRFFLMSPVLKTPDFDASTKTAYVLTTDNKLYYFNRALKEPFIQIDISAENYDALTRELAIAPLIEGQACKKITNYLTKAQLDTISKHSGHEHLANCRLFFTSLTPQATDFDENTKKAYILTTDNKLYYFNRALQIPLIEIPISEEECLALKTNFAITPLDEGQTYKKINHALTLAQLSIITKYSGHQYKEADQELSFTSFASQPKQVVQLKEIINGLHHAELAFQDLEAVNLRDGKNRIRDIITLWLHTTKQGYLASYLLTHLDINIQQIFSQEISVILKLLAKVQNYAATYGDKATKLAEIVQSYPISYTAGNMAGIAVDQMQPYTGNIDYNFLAHFSAILPRYIQQLTEYIHKYTNELTELEPTLDKAKINELEENAIKLLQAINNIQDNTFLFTFKGINYLHIIQHVTMLAMSTLEQMGHMSDTTQDAIRDKLSLLKYTLLVQLFALTDKVEDEALLAPGTLSNSLMQAIVPLYQEIIRYASKPVDFSKKGQALLTIEDPKFIQLRIRETQQRINAAKKQLFKAQEIQDAFNSFFTILESQQGFNRIIDLPNSVKKELTANYIYIHAYFEKIDVELHNEILRGLQNSAGTRVDQLRNIYFQARGHTTDHIKKLVALKPSLINALASDVATHKFHIESNQRLIESIYKHADLTVCPIEFTDNQVKEVPPVAFPVEQEAFSLDAIETLPRESSEHAEASAPSPIVAAEEAVNTTSKLHPLSQILSFNEPTIIKLSTDKQATLATTTKGSGTIINEPNRLTTEQTINLLQYYQEQHASIITAKNKFSLFLSALSGSERLIDKKNKEELRRWYAEFQPYFLRVFLTNQAIDIGYFDEVICSNLKNKLPDDSSTTINVTRKHFNRLSNVFNQKMNEALTFCEQRIEIYQTLAKSKFKTETEQTALQPNYTYGNRAHHLIKHTNYSKAVSEFRKAVINLTGLFSDPLQARLKAAKSGTPFPEIEEPNGALAQSQQVLSIKQIYNSLYHLEQICVQLEALNNKSSQSIYVMHLIRAYSHIDEIDKAARDLYTNPYLALLGQELIAKASKIREVFLTQTDAYSVDPTSVTQVPGQVKQNAIWYALQTFILVPAHIKALSEKRDLSKDELTHLQTRTKDITIKIERIIAKSDSHFKLLLEAPTMYELFTKLKQNLAEFTTITHDAVLDNIREINTVIFTDILIETDKWEDQLGLKAGLLSGPMKEILEEFYRGLVEPLGFTSDNYFELITDITPFIKRKEACEKVAVTARQKLADNNLQANCAALKELDMHIDHYINFTTGFIPPTYPFVIDDAKDHILQACAKLQPFLKEQQNNSALATKPATLGKLNDCIDITNVVQLMKLLNDYSTYQNASNVAILGDTLDDQKKGKSIPAEDDSIELVNLSADVISISNPLTTNSSDINLRRQQIIDHYHAMTASLSEKNQLAYDLPKELNDEEILNLNPNNLWQTVVKQFAAIKTINSYYQGIYSTYKVTEETAEKKKQYITALQIEQTQINKQLKHDFIHNEINKRVQTIINQQTDLINLNSEYNHALEKDLLDIEFQSDLIKKIYNESDIKLAIKEKLLERAQQFKKINLDKYARLDYVLSAITDFQIYLRKSSEAYKRGYSIFEDTKTITSKKAQINILIDLAKKKNPDDSVEHRFRKVQKYVDNDISFGIAMVTYRTFDKPSFNWLINCILSLLKALHLYKPTSLKCFEQVKDATAAKPKHMPRYGFFTEPTREARYDLPFRLNLDAPDTDIELDDMRLPAPLTV